MSDAMVTPPAVTEPESFPPAGIVVAGSARALVPMQYPALDQNPAAVYLAHLKPSGRRTMRQALNVIAGLLTSGKAEALACPWPAFALSAYQCRPRHAC